MDVVPDWPPYSPDMNPIERIWGIMKRRIRRNDNLNTHDGLLAAVQREWSAIRIQTINKMCANFGKTLDAIIAANGARTKK